MTVYDDLVARCLPLISDYHNDLLVHDKAAIECSPGIPFLHWTRSSGTCIVMLPPVNDSYWPKMGEVIKYLFGTATREHLLREIVSLAKYHTKPYEKDRYTCHYCNGKTIKAITVEEAVDIAMDYTRKINRVWDMERLREHNPTEYRRVLATAS